MVLDKDGEIPVSALIVHITKVTTSMKLMLLEQSYFKIIMGQVKLEFYL